MALHNTGTYVTASCDMCGSDWWHGYEDSRPLFPSHSGALRILPVDFMWTITEQADGSLQMLCASCTQIEECVRNGHSWADLIYTIDGDTNKYGESCTCCSVVRSFDTPPAGHPESMTVVLSDAEEEWLAALDIVLDPDNASKEV